MRINEDYFDQVTVNDIDDEDVVSVGYQEPSPGKWKFAMLIIGGQKNSIIKRCQHILDLYADDYNIFEVESGELENYLTDCVFEYNRNSKLDLSNASNSLIVEFNCKQNPYIPIYALSIIQKGIDSYFLTYESSKYTISQTLNQVYLFNHKTANEEVDELLVRAIVDMVEYGNGNDYDYYELHMWVVKRQQEAKRKQ